MSPKKQSQASEAAVGKKSAAAANVAKKTAPSAKPKKAADLGVVAAPPKQKAAAKAKAAPATPAGKGKVAAGAGKAKVTKLPVEGGAASKKKAPRSTQSFGTYIYRVLKELHPDTGLSSRSVAVFDNLIKDIIDRLQDEAETVMRHGKTHTLTDKHVASAAILLLRGEMAKHAVAEGTKAVVNYNSSSASASE